MMLEKIFRKFRHNYQKSEIKKKVCLRLNQSNQMFLKLSMTRYGVLLVVVLNITFKVEQKKDFKTYVDLTDLHYIYFLSSIPLML